MCRLPPCSPWAPTTMTGVLQHLGHIGGLILPAVAELPGASIVLAQNCSHRAECLVELCSGATENEQLAEAEMFT